MEQEILEMEQEITEVVQEVARTKVGGFYIEDIVSAAIIFAVSLVVIRVLVFVIHRMLRRSKKLDVTLRGFLEGAVKAVLWILTFIIIAETLGIPTTSLVAAVSVIGLALSLSIQSTVANLFSGITLLVTKPFEVGDLVDVASKVGTVRRIGLFYTVMDTVDNLRVSIPNGDVTSTAVINYTADPTRRVDVAVTASYDTPTQLVHAAALEAAAADERILTDPAPFVSIQEYQSSSIKYIIRVWCRNTDYWDVYFGLTERLRECFEKHGAQMSYDHINVHMIDPGKKD